MQKETFSLGEDAPEGVQDPVPQQVSITSLIGAGITGKGMSEKQTARHVNAVRDEWDRSLPGPKPRRPTRRA